MEQNTVTAGYGFTGTGVESAEEQGALARLDSEIQYLEEEIGRLEARVGPILNQYMDEKLSQPQPEPATQFRGRIERLTQLRVALGVIINRIDI